MAPLISQDVDSLVGGITEQPAEVRKDSQVSAAENVTLDPAVGLQTRPSTKLVNSTAPGFTTSNTQSVTVHTYDGGPGHRYILKIAAGTASDSPVVKALNVESGAQQTISVSATDAEYLKSNPLSDNTPPSFSFAEQGNTIFIANDRVLPAIKTTSEPASTFQTCMWFRAPILNKTSTDYESMILVSEDDDGKIISNLTILSSAMATSNSEIASSLAAEAYSILTDLGITGSGWGHIAVGHGYVHSYDPVTVGALLPFENQNVWAGASIWNVSTFGVGGTSGNDLHSNNYIRGGNNQSRMPPGPTLGWNWKLLGYSDQNQFISSSSNLGVIVGNYYEDGRDWEGNSTGLDELPSQHYEIKPKHWSLDSGSENNVVIFSTERGPLLEYLPPVCEDGFVAPITTDDDSAADYYMKFDKASGSWIEGRKRSEDHELNEATMPHKFTYDPTTSTFSFGTYTWKDRLVGDVSSHLQPSFVGKSINDILFYRDRFCIASQDSICFSEIQEPSNFWRTSIATLIDSDRLDVSISGGDDGSGTIIKLSDTPTGLMVNTERSQYTISSGDTAFTGNNVKVSRLSTAPTSPTVLPEQSHNRFYWTAERGNGSKAYEYLIQPERGLAVDITGHCPSLMQKPIISMDSDDLNNTLYFVDTDGNVFVYRHLSTEEQRLQAAWSKWTFETHGLSDNYKVISVKTINNKVYLITPSSVLEVLGLDNEDACGWQCRVDGRVDATGLTYDPATGKTTATTPATVGGAARHLFNKNTGEYHENENSNINLSDGQFDGQLIGSYVWGNRIEAKVKLSPFVVKAGQSASSTKPVLGGRTQLKTLTLFCKQTGDFEVLTDIGGEVAATKHENSNMTVGGSLEVQAPRDLEFTTDIGGRNTETDITIQATSTQPMTISSLRYEVLFFRRGS